MTNARLGRVQLKIVQILWDKREATARAITDAINETEPIAHSTVQTLLRTLEDKKAISHRIDGRTFVFYPCVREDKVKRSSTRELAERVFDGNFGQLISYLLENEKISRTELNKIRQLINRKTKSSDKKTR